MSGEEYKSLFRIIKDYSGLNLSLEHEFFLENYINNRLKELNLSIFEFNNVIKTDSQELTKLINEACINETYFFREQLQFDFLAKYFFPEFKGKTPIIWSAACSTGEESLSLLAMSKKFDVQSLIIASDLDKTAIEKFNQGIYTKKSFRNDGTKYHNLIQNICDVEGENFIIKKEELNQIRKINYNLAKNAVMPVTENSVDLIFLRNVFIYFDEDLKQKVLQKMYKALKPGGLLFFSINEIPTIEEKDLHGFIKENEDSVYYLKKIVPFSNFMI